MAFSVVLHASKDVDRLGENRRKTTRKGCRIIPQYFRAKLARV